MFRPIAILFLLLLPLQFAWAAAGAYCEHESGPHAWHFGHHPHGGAEPHEHEDGTPTDTHPDCASCALHCKTVTSAPFATLAASPASVPIARHGAPPFPPPPSRIERPNWTQLAA